jgi:hypothetical protein
VNNLKPIKSLWLSIVSYFQDYVLTDEEKNGYMSQVLYASRKFDDCDGEWSTFHMHLVLSIDTWKNQVKSMGMGASNKEAQVSPTMVAVIYYVVMIHEIWTRGDQP